MATMRTLAVVCVAWTGLAAQADGGLQVGAEKAWPRWQARIGLELSPAWRAELAPAGSMRSAQLLGDVYLSGPGFGAGRFVGGLRASGGVLLGGSALPASTLRPALGQALSVNVSRTLAPAALADEAGEPAAGYLGLGYSSLSVRGGWGFSADVGVMTGSGLRSSRLGEAYRLDDAMRELRLRPVMQLGVSYAF